MLFYKTKSFIIFFLLAALPFSLFASSLKANSDSFNGRFNQSSCTDGSTNAICIAVGFAIQAGKIFPMLIETTDGWNKYQVVHSITNFSQTGTFLSSSCTGSGANVLCIAAGYLGDSASQAKPFLVQSQDGGQTWQTISIPNASTGLLRKTSCTGTGSNAMCVAVGTTTKDAPTTTTLIAQSIDGGNTWQTASVNNLPNNYGDLTSVSCTTGICVAIGHDNANVPIIVQTTNQRTTWVQKPYSFMKTLDRQTLDMLFSDVNCTVGNNETLCTIIGNMGTSNQFNPVIYQTKNDAEVWERNTSIQWPLGWVGKLSTIRCAGSTTGLFCLSVGQAGPDVTQLSPLALNSNNGNSWSIEKIINGTPDWNTFLANDCITGTSNFCFAVGYGGSGNLMYPILAASTVGYDQWSIKSINNLPAQALLRTASCTPSGSVCIAAGYAEQSSINLPFIVASNDNGKTWSLQNIIFTPPSPPPAPSNTISTCNEDKTKCVAVYISDINANPLKAYYWNQFEPSWQQGSISDDLFGCSYTFTSLTCDQTFTCVAVGTDILVDDKTGECSIPAPVTLTTSNGGIDWAANYDDKHKHAK